jgi:hypothetical protein
MLAAAALLLVLALALLAWRHWRRGAPLRRARAELERLRRERSAEPARLARDINALLKRAALLRYPRRATAALSGESWVAFLNSSAGESLFPADSAALPYRSDVDRDAVRTFAEAAERWLRRQRATGRPP